MAITDVLRPISVRVTGAGTAVPSGTLAAVTSDDSDATYVDFNAADSGENWNLRVEPHTPAAGYQRHRVRGRIRVRCDVGTCTEDIDLGRGTSDYIGWSTVPVTDSFAEQISAWFQSSGYGLDTAGALSDLNIGGGWFDDPAGGAAETRTAECYVDVDCRLEPQYSPEVRDAAGVDQSGGTVTDTNVPVLYFGTVAYDGLPTFGWFANVYQGVISVPTLLMDVGGTGEPPISLDVSTGLDDGAYIAVFGVRSTIRGGDSFENAEVINFSVSNTVPPPSPPLVTVTPEFGGYRVSWTDPGGQAWDDDYVVAEVYRDDCVGSWRIATVPDGLNSSYLDLAIPQLDPQTGQVDGVCTVHSDTCDITYRVRYWGYVSVLVELPSTLPAEMILGWPGTAASIPSGWSRVTSLDGVYPFGSSGTGAPSATGGAASHSHTTPGHTHAITAHTHSLGGSTGTSNSSLDGARFNGADKAQSDQPHSHTRPSSVGSGGGGTSSSSAPATNSANNVPLTREVIWVASDGAQTSYAVGVLGWTTESVSGWDTDASSSGRFLKGATAAGNGGASTGATTHTHSVSAHTHNGISHDHSVSDAGLSNPNSSLEAEVGVGSAVLPRHTHPMDVTSTSTGNTDSVGGGNTSAVSLDPLNRRLRVLRNTGGGIQTRVIGLYVGTVAALDPTLTLCDGAGGTPDMRTWFARDVGSDSVNSTGGSSAHTHTTGTHAHDIGDHSHVTSVGTSTTGPFNRTLFTEPLGDNPTTGHTHTSGNTGSASAPVSSAVSGTTNSVSHIPPYKEVHFVRLDGTISGAPLAVPELRVTEFASATVTAFTYTDGLDRLTSLTDKMEVVTDRSSSFPRMVADSMPLEGGLHSVSTTLVGEDLALSIAVEGRAAINRLEALLSSDRVYWSPLGGTPGWFAPQGWTVRAPSPDIKVLALTLVRQPWPTTADPSEFL